VTTPLKKTVERVTTMPYTGRHKDARGRTLVVSLVPPGLIGIRPSRRRAIEYITIDTIYDIALEMRVRAERAAKRKGKRK